MQSLSLQDTAQHDAPPDLELEIKKLEALLVERRRELAGLQDELRDFKTNYTQVVGSRLAELAEVESSIKEAEARLFELEAEAEGDADVNDTFAEKQPATHASAKTALRQLFWSVARLFHPDHAADEQEAKRRHEVMAEANRAYQAGDVESLHTLLGDERLQFFCTGQSADELEEDLAGRFLRLKGELSTIEFGLKRIRQDGLYRLKLKVDEDASQGRDALSLMADNINRQIAKARRRLEHLAS